MKSLFRALFLLVFCVFPAFAESAAVIAHIQTMKGPVWVEQGAAPLAATPGLEIRRGDTVRTGKAGAVGIVFLDDTTVSLGSDSQLQISDYAFEPKDGKFALVMRMVKGSFSYVSGLISKLAPDSIRLQLPEATIAVRGTKLLIEVVE